MASIKTKEKTGEDIEIMQGPPPDGDGPFYAVVTSGGKATRTVLIKSRDLTTRLNWYLTNMIRQVEVIAYTPETYLKFKASIVQRGPKGQPYLYPLGEANRYFAELYWRWRTDWLQGRPRYTPMPFLVLSVRPT